MPQLERISQPIGSSGIPLLGLQSWRTDEYNEDLATPQMAIATYDAMMRSDAQVRASANNLIYALQSAQWRIDAAKDNPKGEEHAKFVRSVLMPGETYGYSGLTSWYATLRNILDAPFFGFSALEKVWGWRPRDGKQVYAALEARFPKTVVHFDLEPRGPSRLASMIQNVQTRSGGMDEKAIPAKLLIVTTFNKKGDNFWGESVLRPAHFHWRIKREVMKWDAIAKERMGGVFWIQAREGAIPTPTQIADAKRAIQAFRMHEKAGLYLPSCFELKYAFPTGDGGNFIATAEYHDRMIERSMVSQFQSLGSGEKGARSVGEVQLDFMLLAYQGVGKLVEDSVGEQGIVDLIDTNFGEQEFYPRLACENFLQMKPDRMAVVLKPLIDAGAVRIDRPLRVYFRQKFALPEEDEATMEPVPQKTGPFGASGSESTPPADGAPPKMPPGREVPPANKTRKAAAPAAPTTPFKRDPLPHEQHVAFDAMRAFLDKEPARVWWQVVVPIREDQVKEMASIASGATVAQLTSPGLLLADPPELKRLGDALSDALLSSYTRGRQSVLEEARRARAGATKRGILKRLVAAIRKAPDTLEEDYPPEPTSAQATWIKRLAQSLALGMSMKMAGEALKAAIAARDLNESAAEVEAQVRSALEGLSAAMAMADVAGKVTQAFTTGRVEQGQAMADEITQVFYSAMLDENTCGPCESMDGAELDPDTYEDMVPNPYCEGGDRCRCEPIFVFTAQSAAEAA